MTAGVLFIHAGLILVLDSVDNFCNVGKHDWRAVAIRDYDIAIVLAGDQLIVGINLGSSGGRRRSFLGGVDARLGNGGAQILQIDAIGRQRSWVSLNATAGFWPPLMVYQTDGHLIAKFWEPTGYPPDPRPAIAEWNLKSRPASAPARRLDLSCYRWEGKGGWRAENFAKR